MRRRTKWEDRSEAHGSAECLAKQRMVWMKKVRRRRWGRSILFFGVPSKNGFEQLADEFVKGTAGTAVAASLVDLVSEEGLEAAEAWLWEAAAKHGSVEVSLEWHSLKLVQQITLFISKPPLNLCWCLHCCLWLRHSCLFKLTSMRQRERC